MAEIFDNPFSHLSQAWDRSSRSFRQRCQLIAVDNFGLLLLPFTIFYLNASARTEHKPFKFYEFFFPDRNNGVMYSFVGYGLTNQTRQKVGTIITGMPFS